MVENNLYDSIVDAEELANIELRCISVFSDNYFTSNLKGLTQADFSNNKVIIFIADNLRHTQFRLTFFHELLHASQFLWWMNSALSENEMAEKLNLIHSHIKPQSLNASYQTMAQLKRFNGFKSNTKQWLRSYVTMQFCMELMSYQYELSFASLNKIPDSELSDHLKALKAGNEEPLHEFLNITLIKRLFDAPFSKKQLKKASLVCAKAHGPVELFSALAEALNLVKY